MKITSIGKPSGFGEVFLKLIMRTFAFLFCSICFALSPNKGLSQNADVIVEKGKIMNVKQAFKLINKQTDYKFGYRSDLLKNAPELFIEKGTIKVGTLLDRFLSPINFMCLFTENKTILVKKKPRIDEGKMPQNNTLNADQLQVSGTVSDNNGQPLPGASIVEKGTTNGTQTDFDGNYTIALTDKKAILVFSYIGFVSQEISVQDKTVVNVSLKEDAAKLDEVIVVGYGSSKRNDLTGSIARADIESFKESPNTNILQSLSGTVPGLNIGQTSTAGENPTIEVRGRTSLNGSIDPLIVVDGAIFRGSLNDLNPSDIKAVDVLKDASSKAIYGAQSANGVILISTKGGKREQKPTITYNTFYTTQSPIKSFRPLNREEFLRGARDRGWREGYLAPDFRQENPDFDVTAWISSSPAIVEGFQNGTDFDWVGGTTTSGSILNHQISYSGGSNSTSYFLSAGYTEQQNWVINDKFNRKNVRINIDTDITPWLTIGANSYGSFSDFSGESPDIEDVMIMLPLARARDDNGEFIINPTGSNTVNGFLQAESQDEDRRNNISGVFYGKVKIPWVDGLTYRINYSNNYRWTNRFNSNVYSAGLTGEAFKEYTSNYDWALDNIINYNKEFGDHAVELTLVAGRNKIEFDRTEVRGVGFDDLTLGYHAIPQAAVQTNVSEGWEEKFSYQTARVNYNFKNKYFLTGTIRRDGFSGFAENEKTALFPSMGLGWVLSDDLDLEETFVDRLKLRTSYGITGNLTSRFSSLASIEVNPESQFVFGDGGSTVNGQFPSSLGNPNLTWETTAGLNIGLDFSLFDYRINGSIDFYNSTTTDLLWFQALPRLTGFEGVQTNLGEIKNTGLELVLNAKVIDKPDFSWNIATNFSTNRNRVQSILGLDIDGDGREDDLIASGLFIGESIGTIFDYDVQGVWQIAEEGNLPAGFSVGGYKLNDVNNDNLYDADDRTIIGREEPAYTIGVQNTFNYKNLKLSFFVKSIQGGKNGYLGQENPLDGGINSQTVFDFNILNGVDYWTPSNPNARFKALGVADPLPVSQYLSRSFIRLQDISLAYDFDKEGFAWMEAIGAERLKVYVSGKNLITITDWLGWDPETGQGLEISNNTPVMKSLSAGIEVTF